MKKKVKILEYTVDLEEITTPEDVAKLFWNLRDFEQAKFFNHLKKISKDELKPKMKAMYTSSMLNDEARQMLKDLGKMIK